jgi:hypothetical protein
LELPLLVAVAGPGLEKQQAKVVDQEVVGEDQEVLTEPVGLV